MHHHHVLDLPEITTLLVAYLSPYDVLSCLCVCSHWRRSFEHELWRRTIINPLPPSHPKKDPPKDDDPKQPSIALIASKAVPLASQLPSCRYCLSPRAPSAGGSLSRRHQATHLHDHRANGLEITRSLDHALIKSKGHLIQSLEGLDPQTPLLTAIAVHCLHLRHLELVINTRPEPPQAPSLIHQMRSTPLWSVKEDSLAVEGFMRAVARVGEFRALAESKNAGEEGFVPRTKVGYAMDLESVCMVLEDTKSDFRLLWSLRHLPNLRRLEVQGPGQWINCMVNTEPDRMVFFLEDLVVLLEQCPRIEELVLSSLQLVDGTADIDRTRDRSRGNRFTKLLEASVVLSTPPRSSSSSSSQETSPSPAQQHQHQSQNHTPSSLRFLALPILPHRTAVYLHLLQSAVVGPHLNSLDLSFPDPPRETVLQDLGEIVTKSRFHAHLYTRDHTRNDAVDLHRMLTSRLRSWCHTLGHGPPAAYSCLDLAELAKAFPRTLTKLSLIDVQIEDANLLALDPEQAPAVMGITHLHVRYRPCVCPVEVLEKILGVFRGLTWLEMGATRFHYRGYNNYTTTNNNTSHTEGEQQGQGQGGSETASLRDRQLVEATEKGVWACQYTLRHLDICQMDVYMYPAYCERLMGRIQTDLAGLRDLRVDLRCFRVHRQQTKKEAKKKVQGTSEATETCPGRHTTFAEGEASVAVEEVDMTLPLDIEWRQLDRLYVHGARQFSPGDWGVAAVGWFESLRADEMRWIREELLSPQATFLYCHFGEWREIKRVCE
ncbi:hypothetical protein CPC16_007373 [Podila verticillata]|nr:hypothetical protein CPC16_007373 [Podila verticillata]